MSKILDGFRIAIPWIVLVIGIIAFTYSSFGTFEYESNWKLYLRGIGQTFIAGGIFSLLLKTYQFMGIFKDELAKVVYDTKFLNNRKDLNEVWAGVSKVLFKNKFPGISTEITNDVRTIYFPTDQVLYYDEYKQILEIELIDEHKLRINQLSEFVVYPTETSSRIEFESENTIRHSDPTNSSFRVNKFTVNNLPIKFKLKQTPLKDCLKSTVSHTIVGQKEYKFHIDIEKTYLLPDDNIIAFRKKYIIHNLYLKVVLKGALKIHFIEAGTLKPFEKIAIRNPLVHEFEYKGIVYPKQGYVICVSRDIGNNC